MVPFLPLFFAFIGGVAPTLIWLYFLLREDARCPEPRPLVFLAFLAGMLAVPLVLPFEKLACAYFESCSPDTSLPVIIAWATAEELMKFVVAAIAILWRREVDESLDLVVYMLAIALGFAALENVLFLIQPFSSGHLVKGLLTNDLRFIGSTLLHVVASSAIGFALAFSFRKPRAERAAFAALGVVLAIGLHTIFNFLIIDASGSHTTIAFFFVWSGIILFFALFELLRFIRYRTLPKNTCYPT